MTIFVNSDTRVIVQGMTGAEGRKHTQRMLSAGTAIVGGTNPRKAGTTVTFDVQGYGPAADKVTDGQVEVPVFGTVAEAREVTGANASVIFVPRPSRRAPPSRPSRRVLRRSSSSPRASPSRIRPSSLSVRSRRACA